MSDNATPRLASLDTLTAVCPAAARDRVRLRGGRTSMALALLAVDVAALTATLVTGFYLYAFVKPEIVLTRSAIAVFALGGAFIFYTLGLYPGIGRTTVEELRRTSYATTLAHLFLTGSMFLAKTEWANSRVAVFISWALAQALVPVARTLLRSVLHRLGLWGIPVVVLGAGKTARRVIDALRDNPGLGYRPVLCLDDDKRKLGECNGVPVVGRLEAAPDVAGRQKIQCAIVAMPGIHRRELTGIVEDLSKTFRSIILVPDLFGIATLWTQPQDLGGVLGLKISSNLLGPVNRLIKRTLDIVVSATGLVLTAPLLIAAMAWIKLASRGPAVYSQVREGKGGRLIQVRKLRTMYADAEERLHDHLARDADAAREWNRYVKLRRDPRVLPGVGQLLRRSSLDELPQLWNILRGDMSLVGPRPFPEYHNAMFDERIRRLRLQVAPGLTGLWQISGRSDGGLDVQAKLDGYYIRNWSLWLDVYILARTFAAVWKGNGAY